MNALDYEFYPLLLFCFVFFYLLSYIGLTFIRVFFFSSSNLLPLSARPCLLLQYWILASPGYARGISTMEERLAMTSPPIVFSGIYLFIDHITNFRSFFLPHFDHVDILVATTPVRISSLTERLTSKLH